MLQNEFMQQVALNIHLRVDATFDNFFVTNNQVLITYLQQFCQQTKDQVIYVWGETGSGKSHLQQAMCHLARENKISVFYLSLKNFVEYDPKMLEALDNFALICIDDVDAIAGNADWEEAVFHFYNRTLEKKHKLFFTASKLPQNIPFKLADLQSRLQWGLLFQLNALPDQEKCNALKLQAINRGINLSNDVIEFLLKRCQRDMHELSRIFDTLDHASIIAKRKITIPFVKEVLGI
jgi:DnaA family protein